ncbi:MAG: chitosanase [Chloroflexi bacterium]|nr:chitosanase [Chloroflexota bacterium]
MWARRDIEAAKAIIRVFETGRPQPQYGAYAVLPDGAGLSFGAYQFTHASGSLHRVLARAIELNPATPLARWMGLLATRTPTALNQAARERELLATLQAESRQTYLQRAQEEVFETAYVQPAIEACAGSGYQLPLTLAVVLDSLVHGSYRTILRRVPAQPSERAWVRAYVLARRAWLATYRHPDRRRQDLLRRTVYRMDEFVKLIEAANWQLATPFAVRGQLITDELLAEQARLFEPAPHAPQPFESKNDGEDTTVNVNQYKPLLTSKTFWGVVLMLVGSIIPRVGVIDAQQLADASGLVLDAVGAVLAIYGRITARKVIDGVVSTGK